MNSTNDEQMEGILVVISTILILTVVWTAGGHGLWGPAVHERWVMAGRAPGVGAPPPLGKEIGASPQKKT